MERGTFYKLFPPPVFLQMQTVGLDVSDTTLRFVELVEKRDGLMIGRFGEHAIPRGVIELGEVKKTADLRAVLGTIKKTYNLEFVSVSLPEEKTYIFELRLPVIKYGDIRGAIELSLEDHVPLAVEDALFDYDIIKETETFIEVSVSVVPRALVDGYMEAFSGSGMFPVSFEAEAHSISRSIVSEKDLGSYMIVDFGKMRTGLAIIEEGVLRFTSTISVGGTSLTESIMNTLNVSYDDAEKIKRERGISSHGADEGSYVAVIPALAIIRDEISKHLSYWQGHLNDYGKRRTAIQKIYLCGGGASLLGFVEYLSSGLSTPVALANILINTDTPGGQIHGISPDDLLRYSTAVGLALRRSK